MPLSDQRNAGSGAQVQADDSSSPWLASVTEQVQKTADVATDHLKDRARNVAEQQKEAGADQIGDVAEAMQAAAGKLEQQMPMAALYVEDVAAQLGAMASALRERSIDDMLGNVADFARKQPALFFAGAVATGFALSRFAKSSANRGR